LPEEEHAFSRSHEPCAELAIFAPFLCFRDVDGTYGESVGVYGVGCFPAGNELPRPHECFFVFDEWVDVHVASFSVLIVSSAVGLVKG
jgi:hypothetical protein